jgi:outer membrane protein assembly factor BamB
VKSNFFFGFGISSHNGRLRHHLSLPASCFRQFWRRCLADLSGREYAQWFQLVRNDDYGLVSFSSQVALELLRRRQFLCQIYHNAAGGSEWTDLLGSWDGNEHATNLNGTQAWQKGLGYTFNANCNNLVGVASTATLRTLSIGGTSTPVLFVGGGNATFYALNANTGATIWSTSLGSSPDHFIYSSPAFYKGSIYIGLSSFGDCPLVQGQLIKLNAKTGAIQHIFSVVPAGCLGGGVWGSPTIDANDNSVYFATGNDGSCSQGEPYTIALVKVNASDLSYISS